MILNSSRLDSLSSFGFIASIIISAPFANNSACSPIQDSFALNMPSRALSRNVCFQVSLEHFRVILGRQFDILVQSIHEIQPDAYFDHHGVRIMRPIKMISFSYASWYLESRKSKQNAWGVDTLRRGSRGMYYTVLISSSATKICSL